MQERTRPTHEGDGGPRGLDDMPAAVDVMVSHGAYAEQLPVAGMTVGEVRRRYHDRFDIEDGSQAVIDGDVADDSTQLVAGQVLTFTRHAGEKGQVQSSLLFGADPDEPRKQLHEELLAIDRLFDPPSSSVASGESVAAEDPAGPTAPAGGTATHTPAPSVETPRQRRARRRREVLTPPVTLSGRKARVRTPEGQTMVLEIDALLDRLCGRRMDTGEVVLPDGVKWAHTVGPVTLWVHQTPPRVHCLRWIAKDSPARYGPKATYRTVRVALPYVVVFATFLSARGGRPTIGNHNECFFRTEPLTSLDDTLAYPGLLNCSKFDPPEGRPLSWICTEHLDRRRSMQVKDEGERMRQGLRELLHCLLETGFNYSSEAHEGQSWFSESPRVDPRVAVVEDWQEASARDPLFALDLPWLPVGLSVREVAERIVKGHGGSRRRTSTSGDAARVLVNHGSAEPGAATANEGAQP